MDSLLGMIQLTDEDVLQLVHGGAEGADTEVTRWWANASKRIDIPKDWLPYPEHWVANWAKFGKAAGPLRNATMVGGGADLGVAFLHPECRGTVDCLNRLREAGIFTLIVPWADDPEQRTSEGAVDVQLRAA